LNYRSIENPRSIWLVIIGLELLILACPSLGLGSCYVHQLRLYHPVIMMVILILLVWRIRFGVTGLEPVGVMLTVQSYCPLRCWQPVVSYHTPISGPIHGVTTHENSTTMSIYGYGLKQYVVEFSIGVPTGCAWKL
jgi:hypothetical protein